MANLTVSFRQLDPSFTYEKFKGEESALFESNEKYISTFQKLGKGLSGLESTPEIRYAEKEQDKYLGNEAVLEKVIPSRDARRKVETPTSFPNHIHVKVRTLFKEKDGNESFYGGSGSLVGPYHVLTCGHNVFKHDEKMDWAKDIFVYPAKEGNTSPFGEAKVVGVYTYDSWIKSSEKLFDIALLVLDRSFESTCGWGRVVSVLSDPAKDDPLFREEYSITGYPGEKAESGDEYYGHRMYTSAIEYELQRDERINNGILTYWHDTTKGQSGSAIWNQKDGKVKIIGVHTTGEKDVENSGVRITEQKMKDLVIRGIKETYTVRPPKNKETNQEKSDAHFSITNKATGNAQVAIMGTPISGGTFTFSFNSIAKK